MSYEVIAGGTRQGKLGENDELCALGVRILDAFYHPIRIVVRVGYFYHRGSCCNFNKSVFHFFHSFLSFFVYQTILCRNSGLLFLSFRRKRPHL